MTGTIVDIHVHNVRGAADSSLTPDQLIEEARRIGLTGVNISEHDRVWEPHILEEFRERSGLFVSRGMEVSTDMGYMIVAHPFRHFFDPIHFRRDGRPPFEMTPEEAAERMAVFKLVDEIEVANGGSTPRENQFALKVTKVRGKRGIGASDCHSTQGVGYYVTVFEDELRDQENMLEQLRARRFHAAEGLPAGELRPYLEEPVKS